MSSAITCFLCRRGPEQVRVLTKPEQGILEYIRPGMGICVDCAVRYSDMEFDVPDEVDDDGDDHW